MRVSEGNVRVRTWRKLAAIIATSVLTITIFGGTVQAAQPNWPVGHGTDYQADPAPASGASSSSVAAGKTVGFFEWLHNPGASNISRLYVNATTSSSLSLVGATWTIEDIAGNVRGDVCAPTTAWLCSFGALNAGETVYVTAAFRTAANLADGTQQSVRFEFNATGTPPGGNKSHGDFVPLPDSVKISKNGDADGDFNFNQTTALSVATAPVGGNNKQSTSITVGGTQVGAAVADGPGLTTPCDADLTAGFPDWFSCSLLTTLTSNIEVGNGKRFENPNRPGTPGIKGVASFKNAPNQLFGVHPFVYHYWEDESGAHAELITTVCTLSTDGTPLDQGTCLTIGPSSVTFWVFHNGFVKG
jgi:hypothetical protein